MQQHFDKEAEESLTLDFDRRRKKSAKGSLVLLTFFTDGQYVVYAPSFNLSSYGDTPKEAEEMFFVVLDDYFSNLSRLSQSDLMKELKGLGWVRKPYLDKQLRNIKFIDEQAIKEDFDLPAETPVSRKLVMV